LIDIGLVSLVWGAFYGILAHQKYLPGLMKTHLLNDTWAKLFARFLIACIVASPWFGFPKIIQ